MDEENRETLQQLEYESDSSTNSDDSEKCPICLLCFDNQEIGRPGECNHSFCFPCIFEWAKVVRTCPIDRKEFENIIVFESLDSNAPLRTVAISEKISLKEFTNGQNEYTQCEVCRSTQREDVMLLCDGCDKGFHMDCLEPPLLEIPEGNWYCVECDNSDNDDSSSEEEIEEADENEINDLQNEIEEEFGELPSSRLRTRQQPQIIRTLQSERIRNAILARRTVRAVAQENNLIPSTSSAQVAKPRKSVTKRKTTRRRKRRATKVVEYEIKDGQKFPMKRTRTVRRKKRKSRRKAKRTGNRQACGSSRPSISASFKNSNASVYDLQKGRQKAGLSNFNIFEPTNLLDYVPDDDDIDDGFELAQNSTGSTLIQSVVNYTNPLRRKALIKNRVTENFASTSSSIDLIDSILNQHSVYDSFNKLSKEAIKDKAKSSATDQKDSNNTNSGNFDVQYQKNDNNQPEKSLEIENSSGTDPTAMSNEKSEDNFNAENLENLSASTEKKSPPKKKKSSTFDMFGDSPVNQEEDIEDICPNFSIYGSVNQASDENLSEPKEEAILTEENVDLVQMSDNEHISEEMELAVIRSQPASPDLENDPTAGDERSYTPPIRSKDTNVDKERKKERDRKQHNRRRDLERYNVRDRFKEKSPRRGGARDRFGRNRTRSRTRSNERYSRKKSKSNSRDRHRRKSRTPEKRRKRSYTRSLSRRDSSNERSKQNKHHKSKHKRPFRKSRSKSPPQRYRDNNKSPRRRERSGSDKSKKKKRKNRSMEKSTKEVYTSGQNILVSVNFNSNQDEKRSTHSKSAEKEEPIVDITAKKKINISSKPVAIIDLARSPFKELTPEYKKESNVIELSDSEGEKQQQLAPKSPDSTKLYDPFEILNSPSNENVSSSNTATTKALGKNNMDFTNKLGPAIFKNLNLPLIATNNEENLVSSSSSINNLFDKVFLPMSSGSSKIDVHQNEIVQLPVDPNVSNATIESPYSPGNDYDDPAAEDDHEMEAADETKSDKQSANMFDELFGSSTPPFLEKAKGTNKASSDPDKYLTKLKRQERVIEEVKLVIKPYYSRKIINKDQYKEIMRKAVPKICHNKSGEINPTKIKQLIESYVKFYTHRKKREPEEVF